MRFLLLNRRDRKDGLKVACHCEEVKRLKQSHAEIPHFVRNDS